jgi:hypothetical protein
MTLAHSANTHIRKAHSMNDLSTLQPAGGRKRSHRAGTVIAAVVAIALIAGLAVFIASRSTGSTSPGVASIGPSPTPAGRSSGQSSATRNKTVTYSSCMRSHGVPSFPDADSQGHLVVTSGGKSATALNVNSPQFQAAQKACQKFASGQVSAASNAQLAAQALHFSQCMRSHGVPSFADPQTAGGGIAIRAGKTGDTNTPQFQAAMKACQSIMQDAGK